MGLILILAILFSCSNCALVTPSEIDGFKRAKEHHNKTLMEANILGEKYINSPKERVIGELGKPQKIIHREYAYFIDQDCRGDGCPEEKSDEVWIYEFKDSDGGGINFYQIWFYIKKGIIVYVAG